MKRIHLFEFEDFSWFPSWLRNLMTRYINSMHKLLDSRGQIAKILAAYFKTSNNRQIIDLCSGGGGPLPEVIEILNDQHQLEGLSLLLTDLYPNRDMAERINASSDGSIQYQLQPMDAVKLTSEPPGLRSLICSFHHMKPEIARTILKNAYDSQQPIFIYEISDNSFPKWLWWLAFPINILSVLLLTPLVRPLSWQQIVFTYLIPILPLLIAWDGAVSNARTYTLNDLDQLLEGLDSPQYHWEKSTLEGKGGNKLYLLGTPALMSST